MPEPRPGESRNDWMDRCIPAKINEGKHPNTPEGRKAAAGECGGIYDSKHDNMKNEIKRERVLLELTCATELSPVFLNEDRPDVLLGLDESTVLVGDATYNYVFFPAEEIEKAYLTWDRQPINIDHSKAIGDEVGFITEPMYYKDTKQFKVKPVLNPVTAKYKIADGFIKNRFEAGRPPEVSVGVWLDKVVEQIGEDEYRLTARNLEGDHLALIHRGACSPQAGCGIGLNKTGSITEVKKYFDLTRLNNSGNDKKEKINKEILKEEIRKLELELEV